MRTKIPFKSLKTRRMWTYQTRMGLFSVFVLSFYHSMLFLSIYRLLSGGIYKKGVVKKQIFLLLVS